MTNYKILFSGPVGAGKTSAVGVISDIPPVETEQFATDAESIGKERTTVAMDYGVVRLDSGSRIHLYGTPGQARFDFMWDILSNGSIGVVLLTSNESADPFGALRPFIDAFESLAKSNRMVVGITHSDGNPRPSVQEYLEFLEKFDISVPVLTVDARSRDDLTVLLRVLLLNLEPTLGGSLDLD